MLNNLQFAICTFCHKRLDIASIEELLGYEPQDDGLRLFGADT
jgi:hypothetical protein